MHRDNYNRDHVERISGDCWLGADQRPIDPQRVTDLVHVRNAMMMALSLETLPLQQDIDKLAATACQAVLVRGDNEKLYAGFKLPEVSIFVAVMYVNQC